MEVDFGQRRLRSEFKPELTRLLAGIHDCDATEKELGELMSNLLTSSRHDPAAGRSLSRDRGAGSLYVRALEQRVSNRSLRASLVKALFTIKRDVLEREIKLLDLGSQAAGGAAGTVGAALLALLQERFLTPREGARSVMEPPDSWGNNADAIINGRLGPEPETVAPPPLEPIGLPAGASEGDTICDPQGDLWVLGPAGAEPAGSRAEEIFLEPGDDLPPYARLSDGRLVLVFEVTGAAG
jgi:hypothetical protein